MEKPEYFIVTPSVKLFGGVVVNADTEFVVKNNDDSVHQTLKDCVLTTTIEKEMKQGGIESKEESTLVSKLPEGTVLIWSEETGYIIPNYKMVKVADAIDLLSKINETTTEIEESNNKVLEDEENSKEE